MYTRRLGRVVAKDARSRRVRRVHIISSISNNGWSVVNEGSVRPIKAFSTKKEAVSYATKAGSKSISEVVIHKKDGNIQDIIPAQE